MADRRAPVGKLPPTPPKRRKPTTHEVQAAVEGVLLDPEEVETVSGVVVPAAEAVRFLDSWYRIDTRIPPMVLFKFSAAADRGMDSADPGGMAAIYAMLRSSILDEDWAEFERAAMGDREDPEGLRLIGVVRTVQERMTAFPTKRPSDSSDGPPATSRNSKGSSSSRATRRPELEGMVSAADLDPLT